MNEQTGSRTSMGAGTVKGDAREALSSPTEGDLAVVRRLNQELQRRITELETLFELAPVGLAIARDSECRHIEPNPAFRRLLRLPLDANASRSAPAGQRPENFRVIRDGSEIAPEDLPMQVVARTGLPINGSECQVEFDDGTVTYLLGSSAPLFDEQARPRGCIGAFIDITERKVAEESIRASEARLAAALEGGRMGLWEWDIPSNTSVWNAIEFQLLGLPVREGNVPTSLFFDRLHPDDAAPFKKILAELMEDGSEFHHEVRILRADGQERWLAAAGRLSRDASGRPSKMIGVNYDITERKSAEAALREARAEAETANRAKDYFLAVLSHELRGPLTPVLGTLDLWERLAHQLRPDFREDVGMIRRNIATQARLIDDLLDFNRIVTGKLSIRPEPTDLHVLLRRCVEAHRDQLISKGLTASYGLHAAGGVVTADPVRLEQVFGNVLRNAIKFTATGGISVETLDRTGDGGERYVRVLVRDTGIGLGEGVPPESLFQPFEQGGRERTHQYGGLGLGLAICRGLVEAHGGRISAASDGRDKGMTITIDLPRV